MLGTRVLGFTWAYVDREISQGSNISREHTPAVTLPHAATPLLLAHTLLRYRLSFTIHRTSRSMTKRAKQKQKQEQEQERIRNGLALAYQPACCSALTLLGKARVARRSGRAG